MKRREFLGKSAAGTACLSLGAAGLLTKSCRGANDKIVLALIGCGKRGLSTITASCKVNSNVELKTVCDVNDLRSAEAAGFTLKELGYKPESSSNMQEVFDDREIDAVYISTPDHWHALATIWACQAGKDVYVETNPDNSIREGRKMVELAKKTRRIVQSGFQNRSGECYRTAREYVQSGQLGQIVHIRIYNFTGEKNALTFQDEEIPRGLNWDAWLGPAPYRPYNKGIVDGWRHYLDYNLGTLTKAVHQLDLARMIMGDPETPESVYGWGRDSGKSPLRETPEFQSVTYDYGKFTMTCESEKVSAYMTNTPSEICMDPTRFPDWKTDASRIEIYGSLGLMFVGKNGGGWQAFGPKEELIASGGGVNPDKEHQISFIEAIRSRKQPPGNIEQAHLSSTLIHMASIAHRTGNRQLLFDSKNAKFIDNDNAEKLIDVAYRDNYTLPSKI